ncbi:MAG: hypothetical protein ACR2PO_02270 [Methyloligellaceae bacterium]
MTKRFLASITRISDLGETDFGVEPVPRSAWATGDYVVGEVIGTPSSIYRIELPCGRRTPVLPGQQVVGALSRRAATLECVGDWEDVGDDLLLDQLTGAGLFGKVTSASSWTPRPMALVYRGHVMRGGKVNIRDFVKAVPAAAFDMPVALVIGTSMSAGKTLTSRTLIAALKQLGLQVAAAKLTGAAGYKDALSYGDAGADHIFDYVDAGLTTTVCSADEYADALGQLLAQVMATGADVLVAEIGASPLEAYNGATAMETIGAQVRVQVLCATDPYAAAGLCNACGCKPDFVTGQAANTSSSRDLVETLTGLLALDLADPETGPALRTLLAERFG